MVSVPGRVLSPPKLQYGGKVSTQLRYILFIRRYIQLKSLGTEYVITSSILVSNSLRCHDDFEKFHII